MKTFAVDYQHWLVMIAGVIAPFSPIIVSHLTSTQLSDAGIVLAAIASTASTLAALLKPSILPSVTAAAQVRNVVEASKS
jgi:hypothetical protein